MPVGWPRALQRGPDRRLAETQRAVDNTAAIDIAFDVGVSGRTKHFDRAIHYLRDLTQMKRILPTFIPTKLQKADGFTKALDKSTFNSWFPQVIHSKTGS